MASILNVKSFQSSMLVWFLLLGIRLNTFFGSVLSFLPRSRKFFLKRPHSTRSIVRLRGRRGLFGDIFRAYIGPAKLRLSFALAPLNLRFYERRLGGGERGFCGAVLWVERIEWVEWGFRHAIPFRLQLQAGRMSRMRSFGSLPCLNGTSSMLELFFICQKKFVSLQNRI